MTSRTTSLIRFVKLTAVLMRLTKQRVKYYNNQEDPEKLINKFNDINCYFCLIQILIYILSY